MQTFLKDTTSRLLASTYFSIYIFARMYKWQRMRLVLEQYDITAISELLLWNQWLNQGMMTNLIRPWGCCLFFICLFLLFMRNECSMIQRWTRMTTKDDLHASPCLVKNTWRIRFAYFSHIKKSVFSFQNCCIAQCN